jgi:hypothetical protein
VKTTVLLIESNQRAQVQSGVLKASNPEGMSPVSNPADVSLNSINQQQLKICVDPSSRAVRASSS